MSCTNQWRRDWHAPQNGFKCSECGAELWTRDKDGAAVMFAGSPDKPATAPIYEPSYCPRCGRKVVRANEGIRRECEQL